MINQDLTWVVIELLNCYAYIPSVGVFMCAFSVHQTIVNTHVQCYRWVFNCVWYSIILQELSFNVTFYETRLGNIMTLFLMRSL